MQERLDWQNFSSHPIFWTNQRLPEKNNSSNNLDICIYFYWKKENNMEVVMYVG